MSDALPANMRFRALEGMRAWMAWWVVLGHMASLFGLPLLLPHALSPLFNESVAVNVFVMLSGFVIVHLLSSPRRPGYRVFLLQRAFRLWPAYLVGMIPMGLLPRLYAYPYVDLPWGALRSLYADQVAYTATHFLPQFALHLTLLHGAVPDQVVRYADWSILSPAWSLSLEWQFYLVAPALLLLLRRNWKVGVVALGVALALKLAFAAQTDLTWRFPSFLPMSLVFFFIGMLSRLYLAKIVDFIARPIGLVAQVLLIAAALTVIDGATDIGLGRELALWLVCLHAIRLEYRDRTPARFDPALQKLSAALLSNTVIRRIGTVSYSTYVLHIPLICAMVWLIGRGDPSLSRPGTAIACLAAIPLIYIVSELSFRYVESPVNRLGKRIGGRVRERSAAA